MVQARSALASQPEPARQYHLTFSPGLRDWMVRHKAGLAISTYEAGKAVMLGAGRQGYTASDESFDSAMAMMTTDKGFYLSMRHQVSQGQIVNGCDRIYMPPGGEGELIRHRHQHQCENRPLPISRLADRNDGAFHHGAGLIARRKARRHQGLDQLQVCSRGRREPQPRIVRLVIS